MQRVQAYFRECFTLSLPSLQRLADTFVDLSSTLGWAKEVTDSMSPSLHCLFLSSSPNASKLTSLSPPAASLLQSAKPPTQPSPLRYRTFTITGPSLWTV